MLLLLLLLVLFVIGHWCTRLVFVAVNWLHSVQFALFVSHFYLYLVNCQFLRSPVSIRDLANFLKF